MSTACKYYVMSFGRKLPSFSIVTRLDIDTTVATVVVRSVRLISSWVCCYDEVTSSDC